jgi:hypothetical protein
MIVGVLVVNAPVGALLLPHQPRVVPARGKIRDKGQLADIFGIELAGVAKPAAGGARRAAKA